MSLTALARIVLAQAEALESACITSGQPIPSLSDIQARSRPLETNAEYQRFSQVLVAAASQLIATVSSPEEYIIRETFGLLTPMLLDFIVKNPIAAVLHEHGPKGADIRTLARKANVGDPTKLGRALRYLATRHIFQEVEPNVFAHNRISSLLAGHGSESEKDSFSGRTPTAAFVSHMGHIGYRSAMELPAFLKRPDDGSPPPFHTAFNTSFFDYLANPDNREVSGDFDLMVNKLFSARFPEGLYRKGIQTLTLKDGDLLVDIGGGSGSLVMSLVQDFPSLRYEIQDLPHVIENTARPFLKQQIPNLVKSQMVTFRAHDFFRPQPVKGPGAFMFRHVLHNWPTRDAIKILKLVRSSAMPGHTRLVLFEAITPYCCKDTGTFAAASNDTEQPAELLANLGIGKAGIPTMLDIYMTTVLNSQARTVQEYEELGYASGWKLTAFIPGPLGTLIYSTMPSAQEPLYRSSM